VSRFLTLIILCSIVTALNTGCNKECKPKPVAAEADAMLNYASQIGMVATQHSSGIFYEILDPGSGATASVNSNIAITYVGKFLSGEVFDQRSTPNNTPQNPHWPLSGLIEGWIIGIPLIKEGGSIRLLVPSALAYGCEGRSVIPGNTPLFFEVTLVDVQ
jgi:FKBP-type peptidyl-prolyl cis-trans isomerase